MFPAQRIAKLKNIMREKKTLDLATLCNALDVSDVTVRKYLDQLEEEGFLKKFHGGAMLVETEDQIITGMSASDEEYEKLEQVAELAATVVENNDSVFIGNGDMYVALAKKIVNKNLSVITNNVNVVPILSSNVKRLLLLGGEVHQSDNGIYTCGRQALSQLESVCVQKAFFIVDGVEFSAGVTVNDYATFELLEKVKKMALTKIVIVDSSRFDKIALHKVSDAVDFDIYVTDAKIGEKYKCFFFENNIKTLSLYDI